MTRRDRREANREDRQRAKKERVRNKEFARVTYTFVTLFLVMMGYIVYFHLTESKDFIRSPYNQRQDSLADRIKRGRILDKNGRVLAETVTGKGGLEYRKYPYGDMFAHVVGYTAKGKTGIESIENSALLTSNAFFLEKFRNELKDEKNLGDNVVTTLDVNIQEAAYEALGSSKGAVVAIEPNTGKIVAMVSKPDFDPNTISEDWEELNEDDSGVLVNRATQGQYAPGSTFKVITALEFMRQDSGYAGYSYKCSGKIKAGSNTIHCYGGKVHGKVDLKDSLAYSCNTSFCSIGSELKISSFRKTTKELLFDSKLPSELPYNKSKFALGEHAGTAERMMTAMGQGQTQVSPYHMALITSAIANSGTLMRPYLVDSVTNHTGTIVSKNRPDKYKELMSAKEAAKLKKYMESVTDYGTASVLSNAGYTTAGKTGTAEYSSDKGKDHSWFIGIANVDNPDLVVSVVIEASDGTAKAVNVAKEVFDAYY
jgi:cell division protein FtsI/penicillin-binding protein 2